MHLKATKFIYLSDESLYAMSNKSSNWHEAVVSVIIQLIDRARKKRVQQHKIHVGARRKDLYSCLPIELFCARCL